MSYCKKCGQTTQESIPDGDHLPRAVCSSCGYIHYENPKLIVGCIPEWKNKILLCKRAIEPRFGLWTLPAGFMENRETTAAGAARETLEEANANVHDLEAFTLYDIPHISQVYLMFRAKLTAPEYSVSPESSEVQLFDEENIPWDEIAFAAIKQTLRQYFEDRAKGKFSFHVGTIEAPARK